MAVKGFFLFEESEGDEGEDFGGTGGVDWGIGQIKDKHVM